MLSAAKILRQRADSIGMTEPEIHIEGANHIRIGLAGLTSANASRSLLASAQRGRERRADHAQRSLGAKDELA